MRKGQAHHCHEQDAVSEQVIVKKGGSWWIKKGGTGGSRVPGPYKWKWLAILIWPMV
jgi:hypothetical protein